MNLPGRPLTFDSEIASAICVELAEGKTLKDVCASFGVATSTVRGWALDDVEGFAAVFARARMIGIENMAEEIIEIADDKSKDTIQTENGPVADHEWIARSKIRIDTRKFLLSKMIPKVYGDKVTTDVNMNVSGSIAIEALSKLTDDELRAEMAKKMLALGLGQPDNRDVIDVDASQVDADDVVDLVELNKSLGDIDQRPAKLSSKSKVMK